MLIGDASGLINAERVVERTAIGANRKTQFAVAKQTNQSTGLEVILQNKTHIRGTILLNLESKLGYLCRHRRYKAHSTVRRSVSRRTA